MMQGRLLLAFVFMNVLTVFVFAGITGICSAHAIEIKPYLKAGTINLVENNISEGHKFLTALGVKTGLGSGRLTGVVTIEGWMMGEPLDEDVEIPRRGYYIGGEAGYSFVFGNLGIIPTAGIAYEYMKRHRNLKHGESWENLRFFSALLGVEMKERVLYLKAGIVVPFMLKTNNDRPETLVGFNVETGIEYKKIKAGFFYNRIGFEETSKNPDFEFNRYGAILGVRF